jgi:hypothetical protein
MTIRHLLHFAGHNVYYKTSYGYLTKISTTENVAFSIMILSILQSLFMLSVNFAQCHYCCVSQNKPYAVCHYAGCCYTECHYSECRGTKA